MAVKLIVTVSKEEFALSEGVLRQEAERVSEFGTELTELICDLIDTMDSEDIAIGLAAPQIGVSRQVAVIDRKIIGSDEPLVLINPEVLSTSGKKDVKRESCMSFPPFGGDVERRKKAFVSYQDAEGKKHQTQFEGFAARVVQHECDHLQGVLFADHIESLADLETLDIFGS